MTGFAIPLVTGQAVSQREEVTGGVQSPQAGRTDPSLTAMAVAGVAALSTLGWVLSYTALRQLAWPVAWLHGRPLCGRFGWTCLSSSPP